MRYIITPSQLHRIIYKYLDDMHSEKKVKREVNPYVESGKTYSLNILTDGGKVYLKYYYYEPGEYDDGSEHNGIGNLYISYKLLEPLRKLLSSRDTKIMDIIADWVSENFNIDIDEIDTEGKQSPMY